MNNPGLMRLHWLDPRKPLEPFPDPELALPEPNGLLAIGGDLSVSRLLRAYRSGLFPWFNPDEPILWWAPDPRTVFRLPEGPRMSRRLAREFRGGRFGLTMDRAFGAVIQACAEPRRDQRGTWLGPRMMDAYTELFRRGHAHSVELWHEGALCGGLYGVSMGGVFFGESMFSRRDNASKLALCALARQLGAWGYGLLDCQVGSPHLFRLGAVDLPRTVFNARLRELVDLDCTPPGWRFTLDELPDPGPHLPAHLK